ncbi:hypothetical protein GEMRC1_012825 [Eukaryota sp. GEM-RC1]
MKIVFVITLLIALAYAGCRCPNTCNSYSRPANECFCWCQRTANTLRASPDARCNYFPQASFSSGGCSLCASNINSLSSETSTVEIFEKSLADAILGIETSNGVVFPLRRCKCHDGTCKWGFTGTYNQCVAWANTQSTRFLNGQYTLSYFPRSSFSSGGCKVCGETDPCKYF